MSLDWSRRRDSAMGSLGNVRSFGRTLVMMEAVVTFYCEAMQGPDGLDDNSKLSNRVLAHDHDGFFVYDIALPRSDHSCIVS